MEIIHRCGCGEIPDKLLIVKIGDENYQAFGTCCGQWGLMFISTKQTVEELNQDAIENWNSYSRVGKYFIQQVN